MRCEVDPLVIELRKIYARIRKIEKRITRDEPLCHVVRECGYKIRQTLQTPTQLNA